MLGASEDALRSTERRRLDLLGAIGRNRNSVVISYLTSLRAGSEEAMEREDVHIFEPHLKAARENGARNIDLILTTYGGSAVAPWDLVSLIRDYFRNGQFRVILPFLTYSAGSLLSLGADEIVMGPGSSLGPVDAPMGGGHSSADLQAFFDLARAKAPRAGSRKTMDWLTSQLSAFNIGALYRLTREDWRVTMKLLSTRRHPLAPAE